MDSTDQFTALVETAFKASRMAPTTFGIKVAGDPNLIREIRKGRELRRKTREQIKEKLTEMDLPVAQKRAKAK